MADEEETEIQAPLLPRVRCVIEDYDSANPDHYAQWVISGKPEQPWQCTFYEDLQSDGETYVRRPQEQPPAENPVTDVEMRVGEMQANRATASLKTDAIKARILQALVDGGMDESQGKGLGIAIIKDHFQALVTFEIGGGGATASQVLYADLAADHRLAPFLSIISDVLGVSGRIK